MQKGKNENNYLPNNPANNLTGLQQDAVNAVTLYLNNLQKEKHGNAIEYLDVLFSDNHDSFGIAFSEDLPYEYKYLCEHLLALLCNPKISKKIPVPGSLPIGEMLLRLVYFFENILLKI